MLNHSNETVPKVFNPHPNHHHQTESETMRIVRKPSVRWSNIIVVRFQDGPFRDKEDAPREAHGLPEAGEDGVIVVAAPPSAAAAAPALHILVPSRVPNVSIGRVIFSLLAVTWRVMLLDL